MESGNWRPRNLPLIAFKDAKGVKDGRALRVPSLLTFRDLWVRARYIARIRENRARSDNREILPKGQSFPVEECTKIAKNAGSPRVHFSLFRAFFVRRAPRSLKTSTRAKSRFGRKRGALTGFSALGSITMCERAS
jgi:hypothetical protein